MQYLLEIAAKIPWVMAPVIVVLAKIVASVLIVLIRFLEPASKVMIVAMMLAMGAWAAIMRTF